MPTLVVLGAGLAGLPIAHHVLKHTVPLVKDLKVVLVTPNAEHYWNLASVRGVVPGQLGDDKLFYPIAPEFEQYPAGSWEIILGKAETLDESKNTVVVAANDGSRRAVDYDAVVIATGTSAKESMPWKEVGTTEETKKALRDLRQQLTAAKSIVIAGGGVTGAETAGEIGFEFAQKGDKDVYFVYNDALPLGPPMVDNVRKAALNELQKLKVKAVPNTKVTGVTVDADGRKTLELTTKDGKKSTMKADAYVPTVGSIPNTAFLPSSMLDAKGYVNQDASLRVPGHANLFVVGDAGNLEDEYGRIADLQVQHVVKSIQAHFTGAARPADYVVDPKVIAGITIGRSRATGQMGTWKLPSIMIWLFKGRFLGTDYNKAFVQGKRTLTVTKNW
ncbi:Oxidoreductase ptaL [Colletotrichum orbiculare MAFF 240422]|uniref:Oxidoreductase ptaL n=1 Tax=Colletotrichum orbiculare (strain 104-T / ATCC 96160 / CBS 514.97 / LARS 414 / MAFF 240422) TaxID=1213857 RepID=N4W0Q5_COLOR|nr:Oxidoreductase ptaL [Colletotrichum orbiculare MAFF 240422]